MTVELSTFAKSLTAETAFTVLATAKQLQAAGKDASRAGDWRQSVRHPGLRKDCGHRSHRTKPNPLLPVTRSAGIP